MMTWQARISSKALSRAGDFYALARPYDLSNINDDHERAGREDYSVVLLDPEVMTLAVSAAAWTGPWVTRRQGTGTAGAGWAPRRQGTGASAGMGWAPRRSGAAVSAVMSWAPRRTGTTATVDMSWALRRSGGLTT
jgi:hypothetical protein